VQDGFIRREERPRKPIATPPPAVKPEAGKTRTHEKQQQHERGTARAFFD
jgi:hypothetical protein